MNMDHCTQDLLSLAQGLIELMPPYSGIRKRAEAVLTAHGLPLAASAVDRDVRLTPAMIENLAQVSAQNPGVDLILRPDASDGDNPVSVSVFAPPPPRDEHFERWCSRVGYDTKKGPSGGYLCLETEAVYAAWCAALDANRPLLDSGGAWRLILDVVKEVAPDEFNAATGTNIDRVLHVIRTAAARHAKDDAAAVELINSIPALIEIAAGRAPVSLGAIRRAQAALARAGGAT